MYLAAVGRKNLRFDLSDEEWAAILSKSNVRLLIPHGPDLYAKRNLLQRFLCKMKAMRRLTTRCEKFGRNFHLMAQMFATR